MDDTVPDHFGRAKEMGSEEDGTLLLVEQLARRLGDAIAVSSNQQEENITKILKRLSVLPMTIEILKVTEVGRQVNGLRKWGGGKVSGRAKTLVKKWKQLLPESDTVHSHPVCDSTGHRSDVELRTDGHSLSMRGLTERDHTEHVRLLRPAVHVEGGADGSSMMDMTASHSHKRHHRDKEKKKKRKSSSGAQDEGSFSRALDVPLNLSSSKHAHLSQGKKSVSNSRTELADVVFVGATSGHGAESAIKLMQERSPAKVVTEPPAHRELCAGVKREEPELVIGQSKRSRTQVYSGKRALTGPQVVTSLFDMCMKILIDNIDVIEEVGPGVPYHVLEPLLLRCTADQLLKLEDFNPHLIEDTDELWKKHVIKDFRISKLSQGDSWRDLYREMLAEREEKLRSLTARIKANNHAREEPKRKVILSAATRKPGRRSGMRRGTGGGGGGGFGSPMERPHPGTVMMKRTMKMAKERNHMMGFKHGRGK